MKLSEIRKTCVIALVFVFQIASMRAELPKEVVEVLDASVEASGGSEALASVKSSRLKGSFSVAALGMTASMTVLQAQPDKIYIAQDLPGFGKIEQCFDGKIGWAKDPMQGFRHLSEGEIATLKQNESFAEMLDYDAAYSSGVLLESSEVDGAAVSVLKLTDAVTGEEETHYYSKESGLLLRMDTIADMGPMGKLPATMYVKAYGDQGGVKYPSLIEMTNAGVLISLTFESLELNPELDDSLFAAPQ